MVVLRQALARNHIGFLHEGFIFDGDFLYVEAHMVLNREVDIVGVVYGRHDGVVGVFHVPLATEDPDMTEGNLLYIHNI